MPLRHHLSPQKSFLTPHPTPRKRSFLSLRGPLRPLDILLARISVFFYFFMFLHSLPPSPLALNSYWSSHWCIYPQGLAQGLLQSLTWKNEYMNDWMNEWMSEGQPVFPLVHKQDTQAEPQVTVLIQRLSLRWEKRTHHPGMAAVGMGHCSQGRDAKAWA